ncbi:MAG TPA: diaminopimelate dehydrogenase, partial [Lachnospiraceae bacterium]|nr:diaminopimelate dehydrogenase [Lachnospiraceae bacterium]
MSVRIGILGYGNLGRGVEMAVNAAEDLELVGVFSRRDPSKVKIASEGVKVYSADALANMQKDIDVLVICGGSATDLPKMTPAYAKDYNVVDSFDTHARIPEHFKNVDEAAKAAGKTAVISVGWDPGMFSVNRLYSHAILPNGKAYTFWGRGVSQGHSDAIRRIKGVKDARQYTVPVESALEAVRSGSNPELTTRQKHTRECYVVAEEGADLARIE